MDEKRIEGILRSHLDPRDPDGMRERVLRTGRRELASRGGSRRRVSPWKVVFAAIVVLTTLVTGASDRFRQGRLTAMIDGSNPRLSNAIAMNLLKRKTQFERMPPGFRRDECLLDDKRGDDSL